MTKSTLYLFIALTAGILTALVQSEILFQAAQAVASVFTNILKLLAAPIVFLSILSTLLGMKGFQEMRSLGKKVLSYTVLTTVIATLIALTLFLLIQPVRGNLSGGEVVSEIAQSG